MQCKFEKKLLLIVFLFAGLWAREECNSRGTETLQRGEVFLKCCYKQTSNTRFLLSSCLRSISEWDPAYADLWPDGGCPWHRCSGHWHLDQHGTGGRKEQEAERLSRLPDYDAGKKIIILVLQRWNCKFWCLFTKSIFWQLSVSNSFSISYLKYAFYN